MSQELWTAVDQYITQQLVPHDPVMADVLAACAAAELPPISVSPNQGKFLHLLAKLQERRSVLEVGTLGGYSTIWLARGLPPDGYLLTLEVDPKHAEVARGNFERAGLLDIVDMRLGPAQETLPQLVEELRGPFDLIFIDADKQNNAAYFAWALKLSRRGTVIVVDNVVRRGAVIDPGSDDLDVQGARRFYEALAAEPRVSATAIQTVGSKGYDGFAIAVVIADP